MCGEVVVSGSLLLKNIHVTSLYAHLRGELITYAGDKAVLIECVVSDYVAQIQEYLVRDHEKWCAKRYFFSP